VRLLRSAAFGAVVAVAGLAYYVQRRSAETGEGYLTIVRQLPAQARSLWDDARRRGLLALEEGRQAARMREEEVERQIAAAQRPERATT